MYEVIDLRDLHAPIAMFCIRRTLVTWCALEYLYSVCRSVTTPALSYTFVSLYSKYKPAIEVTIKMLHGVRVELRRAAPSTHSEPQKMKQLENTYTKSTREWHRVIRFHRRMFWKYMTRKPRRNGRSLSVPGRAMHWQQSSTRSRRQSR